jgi:hypothetical protein
VIRAPGCSWRGRHLSPGDDFLFSNFGNSNHVLAVRGFSGRDGVFVNGFHHVMDC